MSYGFRGMVEASQKGKERSAQQLNNPPNIEELHREHTYPDICTPECEHITCPYRTEENRGRPCFMKWKQAETKQKNTLPQTIPETSYSEKIERSIEKLVNKLLEPHEQRLRAIENKPNYRSPRSYSNTQPSPFKGRPHLRTLRGDTIHDD